MTCVVFSGPSLPRSAVEAAGFEWRPPVRQGDVTALLNDHTGIEAIGIVDGVFEAVPTVWHNEILAALSLGIRVYGASSIGALRAAELDGFGMVGVGEVYAWYRDGTIEDDDEVAVLHGPAEVNFVTVTEAMVNLRASMLAAVSQRRLDQGRAERFLGACKAVFYKDRSPARVFALGREIIVQDYESLHRIDIKRRDGEALLCAMTEAVRGP